MSQMSRSREQRAHAPRRRRSAADARRAILIAAERRLIADGPGAIKIQTIARELGLTDAAIHYHFAGVDGLLETLLRDAGRRLKLRIDGAIRRWDHASFDLGHLAELIADTYAERGSARLAAWLVLAGWQAQGAGMFRGVADAIHAVRVRAARASGRHAPPIGDTLEVVALLNLALFADALGGGAFRRSVGLPTDRAASRRSRKWLVTLLDAHLRGEPARRPSHRRPHSARRRS